MVSSVQSTHETTKARITKETEGVSAFTDSLITAVSDISRPFLVALLTRQYASSSRSYSKHHISTSSKLDSILNSTANFLTAGISEDLPTGTTPKKKNWNVQTSWERTQPRDMLVEMYRMKKAAGNDIDLGGGEEAVLQDRGGEEEEGLKPVLSTDSLQSKLNSSETVSELQQPVVAAPVVQSRIPSGQIRPPIKKNTSSGLGASVNGKTRVEERVVLPPLGEAGMNLPRRTRK